MDFSTKLRMLVLALALLPIAGGAAWAQDGTTSSEAERIQGLEREIVHLRERVASLEESLFAHSLLVANRYLEDAELHAMDRGLHEGEIDPRYLQTVRITLAAVQSLHWPAELQAELGSFVEALQALESSLQEEDVEAAADAAGRAHSREHDLSHAIFAFLGSGGVRGDQPEEGHAHPEGSEQSSGADEGDTARLPEGQVPEGAELFVLSIAENGAPIGGALTYRVQRGDTVALELRSAIPGELHLHGYDEEWRLDDHGVDHSVDHSVIATFPAESAGRFPMEFHPEGADRGIVVGYLEVRP